MDNVEIFKNGIALLVIITILLYFLPSLILFRI